VLLLLLILPAAKGLPDLWEILHCLSAWFGGKSRDTNQTRTPAAHPKVQAHTCKKTWTEALLLLLKVQVHTCTKSCTEALLLLLKVQASAHLYKNLH
jgi:hypothetical protein